MCYLWHKQKQNMCDGEWQIRKKHFKLEFNPTQCRACVCWVACSPVPLNAWGTHTAQKKLFIKQNLIKILIMRGDRSAIEWEMLPVQLHTKTTFRSTAIARVSGESQHFMFSGSSLLLSFYLYPFYLSPRKTSLRSIYRTKVYFCFSSVFLT
jgi:hypothetical protein